MATSLTRALKDSRNNPLGQRARSLAAIEDAVAVYRRLAAANPAAYESDLARSLNTLSIRLAEAGRNAEAEQVRQEADELRSKSD